MTEASRTDTDSFFVLPGRIFLDTCVVNLILDFGEVIHDCQQIPLGLPLERERDVEALCGIFDTGRRACWNIIVSTRTLCELQATRSSERRAALERWFAELWHYQGEFSQPRPLPRSTLSRFRGALRVLPDREDRELLLDAARDDCHVFCTTDRKTILAHRNELSDLPIRIITPAEWWAEILPWAHVWL